MPITLDPATEARIQRELARGIYATPDELITRAIDSIAADEDWLLRNREAINERLDESFAAAERGETYSPEEAQAILGKRRSALPS
jgi:predicted transcriptional regulator